MLLFDKNIFIKFGKSLVINYPSTKSISYMWNIGSFLAFLMIIQVMTGMLLIIFYIPHEVISFLSVDFMTRENLSGFIFRVIHLNGASFIFVFLYMHIMRGLYYSSFRLFHTWNIGVTILLLIMMSAFLGYVLPFGQMSFWGATVITNLLSVMPYIGQTVVLWIWAGFSINKATLNIFFLLHFLTPLVIMLLIMIHLLYLHSTSSTNPLFLHESFTKVKFYPFFIKKDILNFIMILFLIGVSFFFPWSLGDPENWIKANPMLSPVHIQPEWYFLFAYAILRCIPSKVGGVVALLLSVLVFYLLSLNYSYTSKKKMFSLIFFMGFFYVFLILTWLGGCPVESPYIFMSQIFSVMYFFFFFFLLF